MRKLVVLGTVVAALSAATACAGARGTPGGPAQTAAPAAAPATGPAATPSAGAGITPPVAASAVAGFGKAASTATPARTPSRRPTPAVKPSIPLPPPPNPPQVPPPSPGASGPTCPTYAGPKASLADVKAALTTAAGRAYWAGTSPPAGYTGTGAEITVPPTLMKAVAWQESGWQSTIIACDGGIGTMQIMPATATWMNQRFGTSYEVNTLAGNTAIGAEYLEWLIMYFGLYYFGSFDLGATAPVGADRAGMRLRDVVISGYNVGPGGVERTDADGGYYLTIPNERYVDNVVALMSSCVCLSY